jgi:peptidoglycan hydrolase-like protein with peptidoglycan-binding domain
MHGCIWRTGSLAVAIALSAPPAAGAFDTSRAVEFAQNVPVPDRAAGEPSQPVADALSVSHANTPGQIRRAQIELRRLDCFQGRADGKLGDQTRQAVKKFWVSAKQPATEVNITDELIADLSERGDNFCRPPRRFFGFGSRLGGNAAVLPFIPRGTQPPPLPAAPEPSRSPASAP